MPFLELTLRCTEATQPRYENALEDVGALAVTLLDAEADTSNEQAILEPGVGETPLWDTLVLSALFPADSNALLLLVALHILAVVKHLVIDRDGELFRMLPFGRVGKRG